MDIGAQLRSSREGRRLSLETVARTIRVQPRVLVAIERNDSAAIPPRPFGRGFVRAYAREVGLNPDQTVRDYFEQFAPLADAPVAEAVTYAQARDDFRLVSSRPILIGTLAIAIVLIGAGLLVRAAKQPARDASFVGTSGGPAPAVASGDAARPVDAPPAPPRAATTTPARAITVVIEASAPCWVTARTDGHRALYQTLKPGEKSTLSADREVTLLAGNAAGLTWTINGRVAGSFGSPGAVRTVTVTPANASSIR
jgi:cytoskeleton protein RodZ